MAAATATRGREHHIRPSTTMVSSTLTGGGVADAAVRLRRGREARRDVKAREEPVRYTAEKAATRPSETRVLRS